MLNTFADVVDEQLHHFVGEVNLHRNLDLANDLARFLMQD